MLSLEDWQKIPWGNTRAGFTVNTKVNRKEFGLKWGAVTEAGQVVVSDEIKIHCAIELVKQQAAEKAEASKKKKLLLNCLIPFLTIDSIVENPYPMELLII